MKEGKRNKSPVRFRVASELTRSEIMFEGRTAGKGKMAEGNEHLLNI